MNPASSFASAGAVWRNLNRTDRLTFAYNLVVAGLIVIFAHRIPAGYALMLPNLAMLAFLWFFISQVGPDARAVWRSLRAFYPVFFIWAAYTQTGAMNHILGHGFHDDGLRQFDRALFGCDPAVELARAFPQAAIAEIMHAVYFSYYLLFPGLALLLHLRRTPHVLDEYFATLCGAFYFCCLVFVLYPAAGPVNLTPAPPAGAVFSTAMEIIYRWFELPGGAFPSSHVAVAVIVLVFALKFAPRWAGLYLPACLGILPATVYCSYHYAVDVIAGVAVALGALAVARWRRTGMA
jgi:membrane-associated phospholipid phosphatase